MLSRTLVFTQRVLRTASVTSSSSFMPSTLYTAPVVQIPRRSLVTVITEDDEVEEELMEFSNHVEFMGSESYPAYRREALMKSEKRKMQKSRKIGKRANHKVRALVDFIEFKNSHKFQ